MHACDAGTGTVKYVDANYVIPAADNFLITFGAVVLLSMTAAYIQKRMVRKLILETRVGKRFANALTMQFIK